jgi:hypothetical protein
MKSMQNLNESSKQSICGYPTIFMVVIELYPGLRNDIPKKKLMTISA